MAVRLLAATSLMLLAIAFSGPAHGQATDWSGVQAADREWIEDACAPSRRLGETYYQPCLERNIKAVLKHARSSQRGQEVAACEGDRQRGPYYYYACIDQSGLRSTHMPGASPAPRKEAEVPTPAALPSWKPISMPRMDTEMRSMTPEDIFRRVSASIYVVIAAIDNDRLRQRKQFSQGSAVAVTERELVTNCHVVADRRLIILAQKSRRMLADVVAADRRADRCVLRAQEPVQPITAIRRYDDLAVGERAYSIGSPSGLENTLSEGLVSGLRQLNGIRLVQTTAPVSPGSSGGGLFDARGNLIGITTFIARNAQNLNFAMSIDEFLGP